MSEDTLWVPRPELASFFHTKKGKPVACPSPLGPIADSHTHLTCLEGIEPSLALARASLAGVSFMLTLVDPTEDARDPQALIANLATWREQARRILDAWGCWSSAVPRVRLAVGCHPHNARLFDRAAHERMAWLLAQPVCSAVGEIGLDYHYDLSPREVQREVFAEQLDLARAINAPLSLHVREAHDDAARIMREQGLPQAGTVMHCFDCDLETLRTFVHMGCHVGIGGAVTFASMGPLREALSSSDCPDNRIVCETDAPYMAPVPLRGTACEPACVALTVNYLANLRADALGRDCKHSSELFYRETLDLFDSHAGFSVPSSFGEKAQPTVQPSDASEACA